MDNSNIFFVAIIAVIALIVVGLVVTEGYCLPTGVPQTSSGGYMKNFGWPTAMPYDSFARQTMASSNKNVCVPNAFAANNMSCTTKANAIQMASTSGQTTSTNDSGKKGTNNEKKTDKSNVSLMQQVMKQSDRCTGSPDYGSVLSMQATSVPMTTAVDSMVMLQGPDVSYKYTFTPERGNGRYGWNSSEGGMTAYGSAPSGCGFKLFSAAPLNPMGPAGSFTTPPVQLNGSCNDSQGYNLALGVM